MASLKCLGQGHKTVKLHPKQKFKIIQNGLFPVILQYRPYFFWPTEPTLILGAFDIFVLFVGYMLFLLTKILKK